jgi:hypothetical protein
MASDLLLRSTTANGVRDLCVAAGTSTVDLSRADEADRKDADRLEDPPALARFVASRVLYRRLSGWVWFPVLAMAVFDLSSTMTRNLRPLHPPPLSRAHPAHGQLLEQPGTEPVAHRRAEAVVVVRRTHRSSALRPRGAQSRRADLERATGAHQGSTALTPRSSRDSRRTRRRRRGRRRRPPSGPGLSRSGVCAAPGPSRTVIVERRGRFGLPPVFTSVDRLGIVRSKRPAPSRYASLSASHRVA